MKTHVTHRPRFACRVVRRWMSLYGDGKAGEPRGLAAEHVATCDDCRRFLSACDELEIGLKRDAARDMQAAPSGLDHRIIRAVNLAVPEPRSRKTHYIPLALAGAVACFALTLLVFQGHAPLPRAATTTYSVLATDEVWTSLKPSADALLSGEPLQQEVDAVVSDAQSALRFLKGNFLPSAPKSKDGRD